MTGNPPGPDVHPMIDDHPGLSDHPDLVAQALPAFDGHRGHDACNKGRMPWLTTAAKLQVLFSWAPHLSIVS